MGSLFLFFIFVDICFLILKKAEPIRGFRLFHGINIHIFSYKRNNNQGNLPKNTRFLAEKFNNGFNAEVIEGLARETGFTKRKSKLRACQLFESLMFAHHQGKSLSLIDLCADLLEEYGVEITKQGIHERFNAEAVLFFHRVLGRLLSAEFNVPRDTGLLSRFGRVRIKDSTKFSLPEAFAEKYGGYGGALANSEAMISIQYEYDLLNGETMDLRLTNGVANDQSDSRDFTGDIRKDDLFIRDLGYSTLPYLEKVSEEGAFFVSRLPAQTSVYAGEGASGPMDFKKYHKMIRKHKLSHMELDVFVGKKAMLPCRLVIMPVDDATYEKRIRKTSKQAKSTGNNVSEEFKTRSRLNLFITNVDRRDLDAGKVREVYTLRWQIELVFKIWKSQARIDDIKEMKIERFECQLLSRLIWLLLNWRMFKWLNNVMFKKERLLCSVWKFYKYAARISQKIRKALKDTALMEKILIRMLEIAPRQFKLEKKKNQLSQNQTFIHLA